MVLFLCDKPKFYKILGFGSNRGGLGKKPFEKTAVSFSMY
jgi:hypothetical protein